MRLKLLSENDYYEFDDILGDEPAIDDDDFDELYKFQATIRTTDIPDESDAKELRSLLKDTLNTLPFGYFPEPQYSIHTNHIVYNFVTHDYDHNFISWITSKSKEQYHKMNIGTIWNPRVVTIMFTNL